MKKIYVILGTTRQGRISHTIGDWFMGTAKTVIAADTELELVDLATWNLPLLDEPVSPKNSNAYVHEHTRRWSQKIAQADGFVLISAEYNDSLPASLKNALDYLYQEWTQKPVGFVTYGWGAGSGARRHLVDITRRLGMKVIEDGVAIQFHSELLGKNGELLDAPQNLAPYARDAEVLIRAVTDAA